MVTTPRQDPQYGMIINNSPKRRLPPSESPSLCNPNLKNGNGTVLKDDDPAAAVSALKTPPPTITSSNSIRTPISHTLSNGNGSTDYSDLNSNAESNSGLGEEPVMLLSQSMESINNMHEGVRTLFVSGLPLDTKARELYLLFRGYKGFMNAQLKSFSEKMGKIMHPVGFVTFETREQAEVAMADLKGVKFDPDGIQHMRLEFARSNTKVTKPKAPAMPMNLGPLGITGLMNNSMSGIPTVSSPTQYSSQHQNMLNHQHAMNLANFTAAVNGNGLMTNFSPALFPHLPAFDASLLAQNQENQANWAASLNPFELLSQAGLLSTASLNPGPNNSANNSLNQQNLNPAAFFQANNQLN